MMLHLLKLVWNRKRATALLIAEITCCFLLLFAVAAITTYIAGNYSEPLGYSYQNVWDVRVDFGREGDDWTEEQAQRFARLVAEARAVDGVEASAAALLPPFELGGREGTWRVNGRAVTAEFDEVSDDFAAVLGIEVLRGRWFEPSDDVVPYVPVVIDEDAAREIFGSDDPLGKVLDPRANPPSRVVGLIREFRKDGELSPDTNFIFERKKLGDAEHYPVSNILVRVRADAPRDLEQRLRERLDAAGGDWTVEVQSLAEARRTIRKIQLTPIIVLSVVAAFLVLMVAFGLSGVLWQNITTRRAELGLRRAIGASGGDIHRQVLTEVLLISTLGLLLGVAVVSQIPILGLFSAFKTSQFFAALGVSVTVIYLMTAMCGLYPSWFATRILPAEALRSE